MNKVYLQLGSNIGHRQQHLFDAAEAISSYLGEIIIRSKIYESTPWRVDGQNNYLNQVVVIQTLCSAEETLSIILQIENDLGRVRIEKWGERLIDIDIIFFNDDIYESSHLCIPHKHMHERNFVLVPLNEIASNFVHPKYNKKVSDLFMNSTDIEKVIEYEV